MVKIIVLTFLFSTITFAQEAQVTVLEAPMFAIPNEKSEVVQYARKGDIIYIHPTELARDRYEGLLDTNYEEMVAHDESYTKEYKDKFFPQEETYIPPPNSKFYKTIGKSGADAYILKEHVFLLYKDVRELDQKVVKNDPTDYRIEEPLPKGYPIAQEGGYRGQFLVSMGTPATSNYPYSEPIRDTGFDYNKELVFVWSRQVDWDLKRRFFFGGIFYMHNGYTKHSTENFEAQETTFKMGVGPLLSYDVWRDDDYTFNMYGSLVFNFYDNIRINQNNVTTDQSDSVEYKAMHFGSRIGSQFFIREVLSTFDFVIGVNLNIEMPYNYESYTSPETQSSIWKNTYGRDWTVQQSYMIGLQSDY